VSAPFWARVRDARLVRVLVVYAAASWALLQVAGFFVESFDLPRWFVPATVLLLLVGLVILTATAWVQAHPATVGRARAEEVPGSWEVDLGDVRESVAAGRLPHLTWARSLLGGVFAFSLLFGLAGVYIVVQDRGRSLGPGAAIAETAGPGIAVLPFEVRGEGLDAWREGMVDLLSTNLDGAAGLRAIDSRTVLARWQEGIGDRPADLPGMLGVARASDARYALVGSAVAVGPITRVSADVYEVESGRQLGSAQVEGPPEEVLPLVDRLTVEVLRAVLQKGDDALPAVNLARVTTASLPALKAYLEGETLYRQSRWDDAIPAYEAAVAADSTFAAAMSRLGFAYGWAEDVSSDNAEEYVARAARLADRLTEREALLVRGELALLQGRAEAFTLLREATVRYPDDAEAWFQLADALVHLGGQVLEPRAEWLRAMRRAADLDPSMSPVYVHLVEGAIADGDTGRAASLVERYERLAAGSRTARDLSLVRRLAFGNDAERTAALTELDTVPDEAVHYAMEQLLNPRYAAVQDPLHAVWVKRPVSEQPGARNPLVLARVNRGLVRSALSEISGPAGTPGLRRNVLLWLELNGVVAPDFVDRQLASEPPPPAGQPQHPAVVFFDGLYAVQRGRWDEAEREAAWLRDSASVLLASGDSSEARRMGGAAAALDGWRVARQGDPDRGVADLQGAARDVVGHGWWGGVSWSVRWRAALLLEQTGQWAEARRWYEAFVNDPMATLRLGRVYEELGDFDRAREAYERFATDWRDADPDLQPRVREARAAAMRLSSAVREAP
jgi:tetratricopeptide (TPR) repeat protein